MSDLHQEHDVYQSYDIDDEGTMQGTFKEYHPNGTKHCECTYKDGNLHGEYRTWYDNGMLEAMLNYSNGKITGVYKAWYDNGYIRSHCNMVDNSLHGESKFWDEQGNIQTHGFYVSDEAIGADIMMVVDDHNHITQDERQTIRFVWNAECLVYSDSILKLVKRDK